MQKTFVMIKPDAVQRGLVGEIITRFENKGLKLVGLKLMLVDTDAAKRLYKYHKGRSYYDDLIAFTTSSPVVVIVLEGNDVVRVVRRMLGDTSGVDASAGTIRGDYSVSRTNRNLVHASDSVKCAKFEFEIFFDDLLEYTKCNEQWLYSDKDKGVLELGQKPVEPVQE